ncbi:MAG: hypothetical protein AB1430_03345 [Pseudomonadota bacterium]
MTGAVLLAAGAAVRLALAAEGESTLTGQRWSGLTRLAGIEVKADGSGVVQVLVFFDPNCPVCARLWLAWNGPQGQARGLATRWIPVAYMNQRSRGRAAALLAENSAAALARNFVEFDHRAREGAAVPVVPTATMLAQLRANEAAWQAIAAATPLIVYRTRDGRINAQIGMPPPQRMQALLASVRAHRLEAFDDAR